MGCAFGHLLLLPQHRKASELASIPNRVVPGPGSRIPDHDVITVRVRRPEAVDRARLDRALRDDAIEQRAGVVVELARGVTVLRVLENRGKAPLELPRGEEERPVDVRNDLGEVDVERLRAGKRRNRNRRRSPIELSAAFVTPQSMAPAVAASARRTAREADPDRRDCSRRAPRAARDRAGARRHPRPSTRRPRARPAAPSYSGAIFTAVCWRLVVAPPMSSGSVMARRSISRATKTISSSDGVISRSGRPCRRARRQQPEESCRQEP